jgi:hypothetical protein
MKISDHLGCYQGSKPVATNFDENVPCSRLTTAISRSVPVARQRRRRELISSSTDPNALLQPGGRLIGCIFNLHFAMEHPAHHD